MPKNTVPEAAEAGSGGLILSAVQISVLFIPSFFLLDLLSLAVPEGSTANVILYAFPLFTGLCSCIAVISGSPKTAALKWLLSLPFSAVMQLHLANSQFSLRSLNMMIPDYGKPSAGGGFAGFILLCIMAASQLFFLLSGILVSAAAKNAASRKITSAAKTAVLAVCILIVLTVLFLDLTMPPYTVPMG